MASNNNFATKADLKALRDELVEAIHSSEKTLREEMNAQRDELIEAIHDSETKLLRAFYDFAESNRLRIVEVETATSTLTKRLDIVEGRLMAIEKKFHLPNAS